ncbi:centromere-associated protein K-domain-containing protein [Dissophora ornata]|nr:centromere-associated protein K-domain-containing protein [Dissophora ornata]
MSSTDPLKRPRQDDILDGAQSAANKVDEQNQRVTLTSLAARTDSLNNAATPASATFAPPVVETPQPPPQRPLDPAFIKKRKDILKATGEILHQRCLEKMERLRQLKQEHAKAQPTPPRDRNTLDDQRLAILRLEEARLQAEYDRIQANQEVFPQVVPEVMKLRTRQMVQDSIYDYGVVIPLLKKELDETKAELASEKQLLKELKEINQALQARRKDLAKLTESGMSHESSERRQALLKTREHVQELMRELTKFLGRHYPPIQPDPDDPTTFDLKDLLEDIMNLSVSQPSDPYIILIPGEYYPPHIEQLINAGIAVRHPRDSQKLRLIDFYS